MTCRDAAPAKPLEAIRAEIDKIDDRIFELVTRRAALADGVRRAKTDSGAAALRPSREAQMLRRLAEQERGGMALEQVWRLWRELIMANARLQFPFIVDTVAGTRDLGLWDLGRAHFCFETDMEAHETTSAALERATLGPARIALLPVCDEAWWRRLAQSGSGVRVFGALPMIAGQNQPAPRAMLVSDIALQPCGSDITVIHLDGLDGPGSVDNAEQALRDAAFAPIYRVTDGTSALVGLEGFLDGVELAPASFVISGLEGVRATILGSHSKPVILNESGAP